MVKTIEELMKKVNCKGWCRSWDEYFSEAVKQYKEAGCVYSKYCYYEMLEHKYSMIGEFLPVFEKATKTVDGDEDFELFLVFMALVLNNRENLRQELSEFIQPTSPQNKDDIKYDMLTAFLICSQADLCFKNFLEKGFSQEIAENGLKLLMNGIKGFRLRHKGHDGYDLLGWFQHTVEGNLMPFLSLQLHFNSTFYGDAVVFKNKNGQVIALTQEENIHSSGRVLGARFCEDEENSFKTDFIETDDAYIGYPLDEGGLVKNEKVVLNKNEWEIVLKKGDPTIAMHIPADASLKKEDTDAFFEKAYEFIEQTGYEYKAITIGSWLMDNQLENILKEGSNILDFQRRFRKIGVRSKGESVFKFVFKKPDMNFEIKDLPEDTSLQKKIKEMYLNNKAIYEVIGYIIKE